MTTAANTMVRLDMYTMKAVGQDEFEDVKVPDAPVNAVNAQTVAK